MKNTLFLRLSIIFLLLLFIIGGLVAYISFVVSNTYFDEANQKLHSELAQYTADHVQSFTESGDIDTNSVKDIMHSMMVINPDVEVYMLDTEGNILTHVAPYKKVVREKVNLLPVITFLKNDKSVYIKGDDPRDMFGEKVFSAAPITVEGELLGYYYIVLASEERSDVLSSLRGTYAMKLAYQLIWIVLGCSLVLGLLAFWYQTRAFSGIKATMEKFRNGNYHARIDADDDSIFGPLSRTFNRMAGQIEEQFTKIASINDFRKELIANVSHDLRTPLAIIRGYTETLLLKENDIEKEKRKEFLENIHDSSQRLGGLVNQLFELSKLESNQIKLAKEPFSLDELAHDLIAGYEVLAKEKNISLIHQPTPNLPLTYGDISLVERVIQNLIDNALKFTPRNGKIEIKLEKVDDKIRFRIVDTGVGIAENELIAIFDRYKSGENGEEKKKGIGLGLAIAKKIIEMHDSTIEVSSKLNKGTSFSFQLPVYS